jgi:hypothetical protein
MEGATKCSACGGHVSQYMCTCPDNQTSAKLAQIRASISTEGSNNSQEKLVSLLKLKSDLYVYKIKVSNFRTQIQEIERTAVKMLNKSVENSCSTLNSIVKEIDQTIKILELHQENDTDIGNEVLAKYKAENSLKAVLSYYAENLVVNEEDLHLVLQDLIHIGNSVKFNKLQTLKNSYDELTALREKIIDEKSLQLLELKESYDQAIMKLQAYQEQSTTLESPRAILTDGSSPDVKFTFGVGSPLMPNETEYHDDSFITTRSRSYNVTALPRDSMMRNSMMSSLQSIDPESVDISKLIYIAKKDSKSLIRYNVSKNSLKQINLSSYMSDNFEGTSTCILPYGDVFIAGGRAPYRSDAYIYGVNTGECIKISDMLDARAWISLFYHGDCMYAFGGFRIPGAIDKAERYDFLKNQWERLPDMNEKRCCFSCVCINDRIFLMSGIPGAGVEYYDIHQNSFRKVEGLNLIAQSTISAVIDERLYVLDSNNAWVYDKNNFIRLRSNEKCWKNTLYSFSNTVVHKDHMFFYNYVSSKIERVNLSKLDRKIIKKLD